MATLEPNRTLVVAQYYQMTDKMDRVDPNKDDEVRTKFSLFQQQSFLNQNAKKRGNIDVTHANYT
jgi:hypothetical protein